MKRFFCLSIAIVILFVGCSKSTSVAPPDSNNINTPIADQEVYIMAGKIDAINQANVSSRISAKVQGISVDIGSKVKKGDALIVLEKQDIDAQVNQAQAAVNVAKANLDKAMKGPRDEQIDQAKASVESTKKSYEISQTNLQRLEEEYSNASVSKQEVDSAKTQFAVAEAQYKSAQDQLGMLQKGETQETIKVYETQLNQAQAAYELVHTQINNTAITSPVDGTVSAKNISQGELAMPGQTLLTIVSSGDIIINAYTPANIASQIKAGQNAYIKVADIPNKKYQGKIEIVDPVIDSKNRSILVKVSIQNKDDLLKPGMFAEIGITK